jgi:hypothetical protein
MPDTPEFLTLKRNRDESGRRELPIRRAVMTLIGFFCLAGLLNAFGQRPATAKTSVSAASLKLYAPSRIRSGLFFEARFTIDAVQDVKNATLVLEPGWVEGMTINTVEPGPIGEASRDGKLAFELGHVPAGDTHLFFLQIQVNPTNIGRRSQDVALYDGDTFLVSIDREVTVFP